MSTARNDAQEPQEVEETETDEPRYPQATYICDVFDIRDKVEDWMYGSMKANDFSTLMIVIAETEDYIERDMIVEEVIAGTFPLTPEGMKAKRRWREGIIARIKNEPAPESD